MPKFHEDMPKSCPPTEAENVDADLYRAINGKQPSAKDFLSHAERGRADPEECNAWGLSVWRHIKAVEHALDAFPDFFRKKRIIKFSVTKADGSLGFTPSKKQPDHHTFWKDQNCVLLNSCQIVLEPSEGGN